MKIFQCDQCFHPIFFENTQCEQCGSALGFDTDSVAVFAIEACGDSWRGLKQKDTRFRYCQNHEHGVCNWLVKEDSPSPFCPACALNKVIPALDKPENLTLWSELENAKHRLIYSLLRFQLPLEPDPLVPDLKLEFQFLDDALVPDSEGAVMTGHANGTITINLEEADPAQREQTRVQMGEHYRTLIGHFRHEVGHYYWDLLIAPNSARLEQFRAAFGDEQLDYAEALKQHYAASPDPSSWQGQYISYYAASHPWEDWAESWAHYFHLVDALEMAYSFGISMAPRVHRADLLSLTADFDPYEEGSLQAILDQSVTLSFAVNSINRSMGQPDLYPFVLPEPVKGKIQFIHNLVKEVGLNAKTA